jgi:hypothetical protein
LPYEEPSPEPSPALSPEPNEPRPVAESLEDMINRNIGIITHGASLHSVSNDIENRFEHGLLDAHPDAFAEIVALGEAALPYLEGIGSGGLRRVIARAAIYAINPEPYDLISMSPDGKHTIKSTVLSFTAFGITYDGVIYDPALLIDNTTGEVIWRDEYSSYGYHVNWSPDSQYAAITFPTRRTCRVSILDTQTLEYITPPHFSELYDVIDVYALLSEYYWQEYFYFSEWVTDNKAKIGFPVRDKCINSFEITECWYVFDLTTRNIIDVGIPSLL